MTIHDDYMPVPMHLATVSPDAASALAGHDPLSSGAGNRKRVVTAFGAETVDNVNPVRPLLPDNPDRICAHVQVTGGDVWLCDSESRAIQAMPLGAVLPAANTGPWPLRGQQAVWVAQHTADKTCVVSFTADYEE